MMRLGRESRGYLLAGTAFTVVLEALLYAAVVWWPSFRDNPSAAKQLAGPMEMLGPILDYIEMVGVPGYVVAQHFFKGCNTLGTTAAVLFAVGAIAGEVHRGTLEIWLARPVTRLRLYTERYFMGLAAVVIPVAITSASVPALLATIDESMSGSGLALCTLQQCLFLAAIYGTTFALSAVGSTPMRLGMGMLFLVIFEFSIYMVNSITHTSIFRLVDVPTFAEILSTDRLDPWKVGGMLTYTVMVFWLGFVAFRRRVP